RQPELGKIHLPLATRRGLEALHRLRFRRRPDPAHVLLHLGVATGITGSLDFIEQANRRQLFELSETLVDDPAVRIQLRRHRSSWTVSDDLVIQFPVQLTGLEPLVDRSSADAELPSQRRLRYALLQIV